MKLFRYIVPVLFLFLSFVGAAQTEYTRYYDKKWKPTTKDDASYMRKITYGKDGKPQGITRDYYYDRDWPSGNPVIRLRWEGRVLAENLETGELVLDGKCVGYNLFGEITKIANYKNGVLHGYYYNGENENDYKPWVITYGHYVDGKEEGWFISKQKEAVVATLYRNGRRVHKIIESYNFKDMRYTYFTNGSYLEINGNDSVLYSSGGEHIYTDEYIYDTIATEHKVVKRRRSKLDTVSYTIYWDREFKNPQYSYKKTYYGIECLTFDLSGKLIQKDSFYSRGFHQQKIIDGDTSFINTYNRDGELQRKEFSYLQRSFSIVKRDGEWVFDKYDEILAKKIGTKWELPKKLVGNSYCVFWTGDYLGQENQTVTRQCFDRAGLKICEVHILCQKEGMAQVTVTFYEKGDPSKVLVQRSGVVDLTRYPYIYSESIRLPDVFSEVSGIYYDCGSYALVPTLLRITKKYQDGILYGIEDKERNVSIEPKYKEISGVKGGYIICRTAEYDELLDVFLKKQIFSAPYIEDVFAGGIVVFSNQKVDTPNQKYGLATVDGKILAPCEFDAIITKDFDKGIFWVRKAGKYGTYSHTGELIAAPKYDIPYYEPYNDLYYDIPYYEPYYEHFTRMNIAGVMQNGKYGIMTTDGDSYTKCKFDEMILIDSITYANEETDIVAVVRVGSQWGAINRFGKYVISPQYDDLMPLVQEVETEPGKYVRVLVFAAQKKKKWGSVSSSNQVLLPFEYEYMSTDVYNSKLLLEKDSYVYSIGVSDLYDGVDFSHFDKYKATSSYEENLYNPDPVYYLGTSYVDYHSKHAFTIITDNNGRQIIPPSYQGMGFLNNNTNNTSFIRKYMDINGNSIYRYKKKNTDTLCWMLPAGFEITSVNGKLAVVQTNTVKRCYKSTTSGSRFCPDKNNAVFRKVGIYDLEEKRLVVDTLYDMVYNPTVTDSLFWVRNYPYKEDFKAYIKERTTGYEEPFFTATDNPYQKNWRLLSYKGKPVNSMEYDYPHQICGSLAKVGTRGNYGVVDSKGREILPQHYDNVEFLNYNYVLFGNQTWGLADRNGNILYKNRWTNVTPFIGNYFVGFADTALEFVNTRGEIEASVPIGKIQSRDYDLNQYIHALDTVCSMTAIPVEARNQLLLLYVLSKSYDNKELPCKLENVDFSEFLNISADEDFLHSSIRVNFSSPYNLSLRGQTEHTLQFLFKTRESFGKSGESIATSVDTYNYVFDEFGVHTVALKDLFKKNVDYESVLSNLLLKRVKEDFMYVSIYQIFDHEYIKEYGNDGLLIPYYELVKDSYMVNKYGLTFYLCKKKPSYSPEVLLVIPYFELQEYLDYSGPLKYFLEE